MSNDPRKFHGKVISVDAEAENSLGGIGVMEVWASTEEVDRHGEIVKSFAFKDSIERSRETGKWPPFLANHMMALANGDVAVIGRVTDAREVPGEGTRATVAFAPPEVQPLAQRYLAAFKGGWLTDVSVGFLAREIERKEGQPLEHTVSEWVELSAATVGSNPTADAIEVQAKSLGDLLDRGTNEAGEQMPDEVRELLTELRDLAAAAVASQADDDQADDTGAAVSLADASARFDLALQDLQDKDAEPDTVKGPKLGAKLRQLIDAKVGDDPKKRADLVKRMAEAAGITAGVTNSVIAGKIKCPHLPRLRHFAKVLGCKLSELVDAGKQDGCTFDSALDLDETLLAVEATQRGDDCCGTVELKLSALSAADLIAQLDSDEGREALKRTITEAVERGVPPVHTNQVNPDQVSEDEGNVFIQVADPSTEYDEATLREIELVSGERPVKATIGVPADAEDGRPQITFLRFPKADGWDVQSATEWTEAADLDSLLASALGNDDGGEGEEARGLAALVERIERAAERTEAAAARVEGVHEASVELAARTAQLLDTITTYKPATRSASARSVAPRDAADNQEGTDELSELGDAFRATAELTARAVGNNGTATGGTE